MIAALSHPSKGIPVRNTNLSLCGQPYAFKAKARTLPYKWPLLADGQDPTALEARLAFHLHRLSLTGAPLREALKGKAYLATALSQGRVTVENGFITELATALSIAADELTRPLLENENSEWSFYRTSARNREAVWNNAIEFARRNNHSLREMANTINMKQPDLHFAVSGRRPRVFELEHARRLTSITTPPADPDTFLPTEGRDHDLK